MECANDSSALYSTVDKKRKRQRRVQAPATTLDLESYYSVAHSSPVAVSSATNGENGINTAYSKLERNITFDSSIKSPSFGNAKDKNYCLILSLVFIATAVVLILLIATIVAFAVITANNKSAISSLDVTTLERIKSCQNTNSNAIGYHFDFRSKNSSLPSEISNFYYYASSCEEYSLRGFISPGYYFIKLANDSITSVYCHMTMTCGNVTGGWMRVAKLRVDGEARCFPGFSGFDNRCRRSELQKGCSSVTFSALGLQYSRVCGTILAYGEGTPDGFHSNENNISAIYVDGISLTNGIGPDRKHIYTFAAAGSSRWFSSSATLPCQGGAQDFIKGNFTCLKLHDDEDDDCPALSNCSPNFSTALDTRSSKDIEMRACRDQDRDDEDILIEDVELYVH